MSSSTVQTVVFLFLAVQITAGMYLGIYRPNQDVYPFSSWALYHLVPNLLKEYALYIHEYDGEQVAPPVPFHEAGRYGMLVEQISLTAYWKAIQRLGTAMEYGKSEEVPLHRIWIERDFKSSQVQYEVVKVIYDPLVYWRSRTFEHTESLGYFTSPLK